MVRRVGLTMHAIARPIGRVLNRKYVARPPRTKRAKAVTRPGDFTINLGQILVAKPVLSGVVWTETGERLAKALASRSIVD
jgi:hypothetical protein